MIDRLSSLIALARTSNAVLRRGWESGRPCLVADLREKALSLSPVSVVLAVGFS